MEGRKKKKVKRRVKARKELRVSGGESGCSKESSSWFGFLESCWMAEEVMEDHAWKERDACEEETEPETTVCEEEERSGLPEAFSGATTEAATSPERVATNLARRATRKSRLSSSRKRHSIRTGPGAHKKRKSRSSRALGVKPPTREVLSSSGFRTSKKGASKTKYYIMTINSIIILVMRKKL